MASLGIRPVEEEIYRHFLRNPGTTAEDVHLLLRTRRSTALRALRRLRALGLLLPGGPAGPVEPADPERALARLVDDRLHTLHEELRQVTHARHLLDALRAEQGRRPGPPHGIEQLEGLDAIRDRIDDLAFFAREEILSVEPYTRLSPENIARSRPLDLRCLRRGVRLRNVVREAALDDAPTAAYLRELAAAGARIRVTADPVERLLVYDRAAALVPLDPGNTARGALLARKSGLVANIVALFDMIWAGARDLAAVTDAPPDDPLGETEHRVLRAMITAGKDETGARDLGISVRTYRRHVADLMQKLGAANRAQAALLARERGWV
jgi:hypothetical protein